MYISIEACAVDTFACSEYSVYVDRVGRGAAVTGVRSRSYLIKVSSSPKLSNCHCHIFPPFFFSSVAATQCLARALRWMDSGDVSVPHSMPRPSQQLFPFRTDRGAWADFTPQRHRLAPDRAQHRQDDDDNCTRRRESCKMIAPRARQSLPPCWAVGRRRQTGTSAIRRPP